MNDSATTLPGSIEKDAAPLPKKRSPRALILPIVLVIVLGAIGFWLFSY